MAKRATHKIPLPQPAVKLVIMRVLNSTFDHPPTPFLARKGDKLGLGVSPKPPAKGLRPSVLPFSRSLLNGLLALCC